MSDTTWATASATTLLFGKNAPAKLTKSDVGSIHGLPIDARSVCDFYGASFGGCQNVQEASSVHMKLFNYYREQLKRISLWPSNGVSAKKDVHAKEEPDAGSSRTSAVKMEIEEEGAMMETIRFRALGILTHAQGVVGDNGLLPWELHVVHRIDDEEDYTAAFVALEKAGFETKTKEAIPSLWLKTVAANVAEPEFPNPLERTDEEGEKNDGSCLSLYTKMVSEFTGVYTGMAVGIVGEPCKRSTNGVITAVLVQELHTPHFPVLPWGKGLAVSRSVAIPKHRPIAARIHFCSGPFPRYSSQVMPLLLQVLHQALERQADVLIIGGPLIPSLPENEREALSSTTFSECVEGYAIQLEEAVSGYYKNRPSVPQLKVIFVSHRCDVTQIPVLPTVKYAIPDDTHVMVRSNPCRISIAGVHVSVCNEDILARAQPAMIERWPTPTLHLRRVVETLVQSRCFSPIFRLPSPTIDLKHFEQLQLAYCPPPHDDVPEPLVLRNSQSSDFELSWETMRNLAVLSWTGAGSEKLYASPAEKRVKIEQADPDDTTIRSEYEKDVMQRLEQMEYMPHVVLLPSTLPAFAFTTHRGINSGSQNEEIVMESSYRDTENSSGVLMVNQELWSHRSASTYDLRVAEISILDAVDVLKQGATPSNTACELLHFYKTP